MFAEVGGSGFSDSVPRPDGEWDEAIQTPKSAEVLGIYPIPSSI